MTDDLKTLATEAIRNGDHALADAGECGRRDDQLAVVDAVLAAVLPTHRRQVLAEVADSLRPVKRRLFSVLIAVVDRLDQPYPDAPEHTPWTRFVKPAMDNLDAAVRRLTSAAPETAPTPRHDDETAPAVPEEAADAQGRAEGASRVPLAEVLGALRDSDAFLAWLKAHADGAGNWLSAVAGYLADRFPTAPQGADERDDRER